jgi:hypothetical protein
MLIGWDDADDDLSSSRETTAFDASINARIVATRDILFQWEGLLRIIICWFTCTTTFSPRFGTIMVMWLWAYEIGKRLFHFVMTFDRDFQA